MEVVTTPYKRCTVIKAVGRVDSATAPQLDVAFKAAIGGGQFKIVFDMSEITFVSSAGWWVLVAAQKECKRYNRGEVILAWIEPSILESLKLVGMDEFFKIYDDLTSAVGSF